MINLLLSFHSILKILWCLNMFPLRVIKIFDAFILLTLWVFCDNSYKSVLLQINLTLSQIS